MSKQVTVSREDLEVVMRVTELTHQYCRELGPTLAECELEHTKEQMGNALSRLTTALDDGGERPETCPPEGKKKPFCKICRTFLDSEFRCKCPNGGLKQPESKPERPEGVPEFVYCNVDCDEPCLVEDVIGGPPYIICLTAPNSDRLQFARYRFDSILKEGGE